MDLVSKRRYFFIFSALILIPGIISLLWPPALRLGIDFTGGATLDITFTRSVDFEALRSELASQGYSDAIVQSTGDRSFFVRLAELEERQKEELVNALEENENLASIERIPGFDFVSALIAAKTVRNAIIAVIAAAVGILLYVTWAFRHVPNPFRYGACAIAALVHDALIVLGLFSLLGKFLDLEVNAMFITGLLTVIGYSVHDTIVVFDRIRENVARGVGRSLTATVNASILETLGRSLNTSLTLVFTLLALILFGGPTIFSFLLVLLIGIVSGTYSSVCIASQLLVVWDRGEFPRPFRRRPRAAPAEG